MVRDIQDNNFPLERETELQQLPDPTLANIERIETTLGKDDIDFK